MPWSGGVYTRWNAANVPPYWVGDASVGIKIEASRHDTQDQDFESGINACLAKDGSNKMTGNLDANSNKVINVSNATLSGDAVNLGLVQAGINQNTTTAAYQITKFSADAEGRYIQLRKSRGATVGTNTIVQSGDILGAISCWGANGTGYDQAAGIQIEVDGTPGATNDMPGRISFRTSPDGTATTVERMVIKSDGRIGIGTSSPAVELDIQKSVNGGVQEAIYNSNAGSSALSAYYLGNNSAQYAAGLILLSSTHTAYAGANSANLYNFLNAPISFGTNNTERMRITGPGAVCIGATGITGANDKLVIGDGTGGPWVAVNGASSGTAGGAAVVVRNAGAAIIGIGNYSSIYSGGAYDATPTLYFNATPKVVGIGIGAGTWPMKYNTANNAWTYDTSKRSAKDNIRDSSYGLQHVLQLKSRQFNYLESEQFREDVGFIADEVSNVIPELAPLDENGEPAGVSYDRLTSVLCKAIQELNAKVEALEARVAALEAA